MDDLQAKFKNASYLPSNEIVTISQLAMKLQKPILVEGPPGVGKTALAKALASVLDTKLYRIQCYEGITSEQIIGEFNYQRQLLAIQSQQGDDIFTTQYFISRPLLMALQAKKRVVLLIDEVDRADEEFEAFLLEALAENQVTIPELGTIEGTHNPIVILTSNNTRQLSGALRRRSLYLSLDYPSATREQEIIKLHVPGFGDTLYEKLVNLLRKIRRNDDISQPPSISEGIELAKALTMLGKEYLEMPKIEELMGLLVKSGADQVVLKRQLHEVKKIDI